MARGAGLLGDGVPVQIVRALGTEAGLISASVDSTASDESRLITAMTTALATASTYPAMAPPAAPGRARSPTARPHNAGNTDSAATVIAIIETVDPRRSAAE